MSRLVPIGIVALSLVFGAAPVARAQPAPEVVARAEFPAGIAFDSEGAMYVTERAGTIRVWDDDRDGEGIVRVETTTQGETGLLGLTVSPDDRYLYFFATAADGDSNVIYRSPLQGGEAEVVIEGLPASSYHNGGGVAFGPDGMLYVSNGEQHDGDRAQDPSMLGGKIYRFTPEGDIPSDNPFGNSAAYAIGYRNPFGLAIDPISGEPFVTENGPESFDEINHVVPGGNGGWPVVSGPAATREQRLQGRYRDPIAAYEQIIVPTGITFADPDNAPDQLAGDLFFGAYAEQTIHRLRLNGRRAVISDDVFLEASAPVIAVAWGPRGLYYSTPGAVKLVELADEPSPAATSGRRPLPTDAPSPRFTAGSTPIVDEGSGPSGLLLVVGAAALLAGALYYAFRRRREETGP